MNVLSLFAGIGGLDLGLERAGLTVVGQVEIDPFCQRVLAKHWPEVPRHDDVRTAVEWWLGATRPRVDVVCGGFPCQPFSAAGRKEGIADERWGWPWFWSVARALRPGFIIVENVAALLSDREAFGWILADLAAGGYDAEWDCVPAASVGAPHLRDRVFVVAYASSQAGRWVGAGRRQQQPEGGRPTGTLADPERFGRLPGWHDAGQPEVAEPLDRGASLADPGGEGCPGRRATHLPAETPRVYVAKPHHRDWWAAEPDVGRVAHGVPGRVDRLRGLGNAVVPQVAEHIGRLVMGAAS